MSRRRVVVTGLGCISALGPDVEAFWRRARTGESGIGPIRNLDMADIRFQNGAEIAGFVPTEHFAEQELIPVYRVPPLAVGAACQGVGQGGTGGGGGRRQGKGGGGGWRWGGGGGGGGGGPGGGARAHGGRQAG